MEKFHWDTKRGMNNPVPLTVQDFRGWINVFCVTPSVSREGGWRRVKETPLVCEKAMGCFNTFYLE